VNRQDLATILGFVPSDEQWAAISAPIAGPMLVLAGAGSGKTAVMSARVLWLVGTGQVAADQVLGLTFTNKAAGELGARIRSLLAALPSGEAPETGDPTIGTYHAFAMDLISQWGLLVGAEPSAVLLNPTDLAVTTFRAVAGSSVACEELRTSVIRTVSDRVSSLDDELSEHLVTPEQLREHDRRFIASLTNETVKDAKDALDAARRRILVSQVVEEVRADRASRAVVGFADLMRLAVEVTRVEQVRTALRDQYRVVLVDEYQDTSVAQRIMLQNLFDDGFGLTAVGDPLQAIYGWRGASVANIDGFIDDFATSTGQAPVRTLSINRRSGSLILEVANAVAEQVRSQHTGVISLRPADQRDSEVVAALFDTWDDEVQWLVAAVRKQIEAGRSLDEIAVLCRTNAYVLEVAARLREAGIPVAAAALGSILHLPEVVEVLSLLRVLQNADNGSLVRLLTGPQWRIGDRDLAALGERARRLADPGGAVDEPGFEQSLRDAVAQTDPVDVASLLEAVYDPGPHVSAEARARLREFTATLDLMRPALAVGVEEAAHRVVDVSGLGVEVRLGPSAQSRIDGLAALFDVIAGYRAAHDDPGVGAFLRWLDFAEHLDEMPDTDFPVRGDAVRVMTVHRAKGLEWECVFVPALSDGVFPSGIGRPLWVRHYDALPYPLRGDRNRLPVLPAWEPGGYKKAQKALQDQYKDHDRWEEDRLAYVALTRARDVLIVSGSWWSHTGVLKAPSPYLQQVADVPGVHRDVWFDQPSPTCPAVAVGDVQWPRPDAVFTSVVPPPVTDEPLTLAESAWLARIDTDIRAVVVREVEQSKPVTSVELPAVVSTSLLMRAHTDPVGLAADLARPMPYVTSEAAVRGTRFHEWVAAQYEQLSLVPEWDDAVDADVAHDDLQDLIEGYRRTPFARQVPYAVETEVAITLGGLSVIGVIDAVFQNPDGSWDVVDWKTSRAHTADPLQLAVYRVAWARSQGVPCDRVGAAFVYVRDGEVVRPDLPGEVELEAMLIRASS
jgi:DNA helicase-2/ATP-dependent DNA helicase PcrA